MYSVVNNSKTSESIRLKTQANSKVLQTSNNALEGSTHDKKNPNNIKNMNT